MKIRVLLFFLFLTVALGCEQMEEVSERNYPFVESIGVSDLDETGVTVNFEVKKNGPSAITSYGLEYWVQTIHSGELNIQRLSRSGAPESPLVQQRISYDLIKERYLVQPYVVAGGVTVYGEKLTFESLGVTAPKITEVTPREIKFYDQIHITGDFFNSDLELNEVKILGLEDFFTVRIDSVDNQNIWLSINLVNFDFEPTDQKYVLQVTSGGKSTQLADAISVDKPEILSVEPRRLFVGDSLEVGLNFFQTPLDLTFDLTSEDGKVISTYSYVTIEAGRYKFLAGNTAPGRYDVSINSTFWKNNFPEKIEVLPSWEVYRSGVQAVNSSDYRIVSTPDRLFFVGNSPQTAGRFQTLDLVSSAIQSLPDLPGIAENRERQVLIGTQGRYFYYGLGMVQDGGSVVYRKDFHRFDIQTGQWTRLADFPFELSSVNKSLEFSGKLYLIMDNYLNFREYDPATDTWTLTPVGAPSSVRNTAQFVQVGSEIYSLTTTYPLRLVAYRYGQDERFLPELYIQNLEQINGMSFWDGNFIFTKDGQPEFRMDLQTLTLRPLQGIGEHKKGDFPLWQSREGLMVVFPKNAQTNVSENLIYRLVQDFD